MSTPPKDQKPEDARRGGAPALDSTFLGVAPTAPVEPAAAPVAGSAIIAAPMISVSDRSKRGGAEGPAVVAPAPVAAPVAVAAAAAPVAHPAARPSGLQGGWQSAGIPRAPGPEQTALHGSPGAWPMPPLVTPAAPAPQRAAAPPRPEPPARTPAPAAVTPAFPPAAAGGGLHHTALASDYLRGARDVAFGGGAAPPSPPRAAAPVQPSAPDARQTAYSPISNPGSPPAPAWPHWQEPPAAAFQTHAPMSNPNATVASVGHAPPPPTVGPPPTAELSSPAPLPFHAAPQAPVQVFYNEPEPGHSPRSMGTQASVAPPPSELGASFHGPMAPVLHDATPAPAAVAAAAPSPAAASPVAAPGAGPLAAMANPIRHVAPQALAGTMMDRTPSIPGGAQHQAPPPPANPTLRFEQVPAPRSSLAQQATSFGLNIPIDPQNATQWGRTAHEAKAKGRPSERRRKPSQLRMFALALLALLSVVVAAFGPELRVWVDAKLASAKSRPQPAVATADQTTLTNLPSPGSTTSAAAAVPASAIAAVPPAAAAPSNLPPGSPLPSTAAGNAAASAAVDVAATGAAATAPAVEATAALPAEEEPAPAKSRRGGKHRDAKTSSDAAEAATTESRLAAEAGKHVLAARYSEALPLYRALQRDYPQHTAYAAMAKVLEQKLGGSQQGTAQP